MNRVQDLNRRNFELAKEEYQSGRLSRRDFLAWSAAWGLSVTGLEFITSRAHAATGPANYFTWAAYQDPKMLAEFTQKSDVAVQTIVLTSNEECFLKVKQSGGAAYDVITADGYWPLEHLAAGTVEPISLDALPSTETLLPAFRNFKPFQLPDGKMVGVPYHWEYSTVMYRSDRLDPPPDSLSVVFDPKHKGRVAWKNKPSELIGLMAVVLGIPLERPEHPRQWHLEPDELQRIKDELIKAKQAVDPVWAGPNQEPQRMFAADEIDVAYVSSSTLPLVQELSGGPPVKLITKPKAPERFSGYVDAICLTNGAAHRDAGLLLIDWIASFRGRQIIFEGNRIPTTDGAVLKWALENGYKEQLELRGVLDPEQVVPTLLLETAPTDLQKWIEIFNEVRAS